MINSHDPATNLEIMHFLNAREGCWGRSALSIYYICHYIVSWSTTYIGFQKQSQEIQITVLCIDVYIV